MDRFGYKVLAGEGAEAGRCARHEADGAAEHQAGGGPLAPRGAPLMPAMGAKQLLQILIGAGESRDAIAVEKPGPITAADLEKVGDGGGKRARFGVVPCHRPEEPPQAPLHHGLTVLVVVVQDVGRPMDPAIGAADSRPDRGIGREALVGPDVEALERLGQGTLFSTRSRLSVMAVRWAFSVRQEVAIGGCD